MRRKEKRGKKAKTGNRESEEIGVPDVTARSACRKAEDPPEDSSKKSEIHRKGSSRPNPWGQRLGQPDFLWGKSGWKRHQNEKGENDEKEV